jgi:hypothetical protein
MKPAKQKKFFFRSGRLNLEAFALRQSLAVGFHVGLELWRTVQAMNHENSLLFFAG